eukprot:jgi/Mesvir1/2886/Mv13960-RA.2
MASAAKFARLSGTSSRIFSRSVPFSCNGGFVVWVFHRLQEKRHYHCLPRLGSRPSPVGLLVVCADFGLCTTPAMFMSCITEGFDFDGAVMLTASHLPFNRNGLKFFNKAGGTNKKDVKQILTTAASSAAEGRPMAKGSPAQYKQAEFLPTYARILQDVIRKGINHPTDYEHPLKGLKLLVDAGNGAGGFFATLVLAPLGADTSGSQFLEPDGTFPNHIPNPEDAKAMEMTVAAVLKSKADLGIVFDTDVDRSGVVDAEGNAINRNRLIAILADIVLREHPGSTIVTDSVTSNGLAKLIEARGGRHFRFTKGYKNIIDKGIALNETGVETHLMIETSGHGAMKENYFLDDGAYLAVKIVIEMVRKRLAGKGGIGDVLADLAEPVEEREFRLNLLPADFKAPGKAICDAFRETVVAGKIPGWKPEAENYEGTRVRVDEGGGKEGWILLRQSLHDPLLPMNVETEVKGGISRIVQDLDKYFLKGNPLVEGILDVSSLKPYM